ncbi:hypothetical protein C8F01DRAFT_1143669, partial [Mycena amicta]
MAIDVYESAGTECTRKPDNMPLETRQYRTTRYPMPLPKTTTELLTRQWFVELSCRISSRQNPTQIQTTPYNGLATLIAGLFTKGTNSMGIDSATQHHIHFSILPRQHWPTEYRHRTQATPTPISKSNREAQFKDCALRRLTRNPASETRGFNILRNYMDPCRPILPPAFPTMLFPVYPFTPAPSPVPFTVLCDTFQAADTMVPPLDTLSIVEANGIPTRIQRAQGDTPPLIDDGVSSTGSMPSLITVSNSSEESPEQWSADASPTSIWVPQRTTHASVPDVRPTSNTAVGVLWGPCYYFQQPGGCKKGAQCNFRHVDLPIAKRPTPRKPSAANTATSWRAPAQQSRLHPVPSQPHNPSALNLSAKQRFITTMLDRLYRQLDRMYMLNEGGKGRIRAKLDALLRCVARLHSQLRKMRDLQEFEDLAEDYYAEVDTDDDD